MDMQNNKIINRVLNKDESLVATFYGLAVKMGSIALQTFLFLSVLHFNFFFSFLKRVFPQRSETCAAYK